MIIEACCETIEESLIAVANGATRIEFCSALDQDGLTPKLKDVQILSQKTSVPIRIMIRPRNSFLLSSEDKKNMIESIITFNPLNFEGYVLGFLNEESRIDENFLKRILSFTKHKKITFHKAIDASAHMLQDVLALNNFSKIDTILTSGGKKTAWEGKDQLIQMKLISNKIIMPAGKITKQNLQKHHDYLDMEAYHGRKIV